MEEHDAVEKFSEFFDAAMKSEITAVASSYPEVRSINVDYKRLAQFDSDLADFLFDNPDEAIFAAEKALSSLGVPTSDYSVFKPHARFFGLPESRGVMVINLGAEHLDKFITVEGIVSLATEIKPVIKTAVWECLHCGEKTRTHPEKNILKTPDFCFNKECGRRDFKHVEKEDTFVNMQNAQMQDLVEKLKGNAPTSHISLWLEDDIANRIQPGEKFFISGILRKRPIKKDGKLSSVYEKLLEVNHLERSEKEFEELEVTSEEEKELITISQRPDLFDAIVKSIAPSIYGYYEMKMAIALQLFGGNMHKVLPDGKRIRGETHILLIGDPGCVRGDERIVLANGAIVKMEQMGETHLQKLETEVLTGQGYTRATATRFHKYSQQPMLEILTESGKSIKGTYNHPLLTVYKMQRKWKRLDEIKVGERVATTPWIPCNIKAPIKTNWPQHFSGRTKTKVRIPEFLSEGVAGLLGYLTGDGWVNKFTVGFAVNQQETDLSPIISALFLQEFGVRPTIYNQKRKNRKNLYVGLIYSTKLAAALKFLREKRVPDLVFRSGNKAVSSYLSWLFEADGCVFAKGRGRRAIQLKQKEIELLRDVQILLLRFGIHSRIIDNNLRISRAQAIRKFAVHIGFQSKKKKEKLKDLNQASKNLHHEVGKQFSEKVVAVRPAEVGDVFDIEVPNGNRFIANGIISHNTAKSATLQYVSRLAPKCIYVSGKGTSGVGLTAAAEKDEFGEGWVLKAGAMVLASGGQVNIDELDKMDENDRSAMHEALESGTVSIAKAGIVTRFTARTSVLAAANPKLGRFNPNEPPAAQFEIGPTLLSRFDLLFPIKDVLDEVQDRKVAEHILRGHKVATGAPTKEGESILPLISIDLLRKYIAYARRLYSPSLSDEASVKIQEYYLRLRRMGEKQNYYPVTARQIEGLVRLSEASAKARFSGVVEAQDADRAIMLTDYVLKTIFLDKDTGRIDSDIINIGQAKSKTDKARTVLGIIEEKEKEVDMVSVEDVVRAAAAFGMDDKAVREIIEQLHKQTEIFRPKSGFVRTSKRRTA